MNKTGKRRLLKLASMLEADAKNKKGIRFNLCTLVEKRYYSEASGYKPTLDCHTTACAMGLAALSGKFKLAGLGYIPDGYYNWNCTWKGKPVGYETVAAQLFDISFKDALFLFSPDYYPENKRNGAAGERYVAKRIRDFVAGKEGLMDSYA